MVTEYVLPEKFHKPILDADETECLLEINNRTLRGLIKRRELVPINLATAKEIKFMSFKLGEVVRVKNRLDSKKGEHTLMPDTIRAFRAFETNKPATPPVVMQSSAPQVSVQENPTPTKESPLKEQPAAEKPKEYTFTTKDVSEAIGFTTKQVLEFVRRRGLQCKKQPDGSLRFNELDVLSFEERVLKNKSAPAKAQPTGKPQLHADQINGGPWSNKAEFIRSFKPSVFASTVVNEGKKWGFKDINTAQIYTQRYQDRKAAATPVSAPVMPQKAAPVMPEQAKPSCKVVMHKPVAMSLQADELATIMKVLPNVTRIGAAEIQRLDVLATLHSDDARNPYKLMIDAFNSGVVVEIEAAK